ncbi:MAG: hypothetical protein KF746_24765 [Chitinophagaceae bacterium]|nr:hypothetical protein [Chitinophagaceae bacterium]
MQLVCIMADEGRIITKIIAEIDWEIIQTIRVLRKPKFSQVALSLEIGFSEGFIGKVENPKLNAIYSFRHINLIAKALGLMISDILPKKPLSNDLIKVFIKLKPPTKVKKGEINYEVIRTIPLTSEEVKEYNNKTLNRPSKSGKPVKLNKRKPLRKKK